MLVLRSSVTVIWVTHHKRIQQDLPGVVSQIFSYLSNVIVTLKSFAARFIKGFTHWHMLIETCTKISHRCNSPDQSITSWITVNIDLSYYCWREPIILILVLAMVSGRSYTTFTLDQRVIKLYKCTELLRRNYRSPSPLRTATKGVHSFTHSLTCSGAHLLWLQTKLNICSLFPLKRKGQPWAK